MPTLTIELERAESSPLLPAVTHTEAPSPQTRFAPILTLALVTRCIVLAVVIKQGAGPWIFRQSWELTALAQSLLDGKGLSSPFGGDTGPSAFLAPGYPAFIAIIFKLFGSYSPASAIAIMVCQAILNLATILVIMYVARRLFGSRAANIAGIIWAISPVLLWVPVIFWESSFTNLALISTLAVALHIEERPTIARWTALGMAAGITLLVNPALVLALLAAFIWITHRTRHTDRSGPVLAAFLCLLIFSPWPVRNLYALHSFVPFRTNLGYELWQGNRPGSNGYFVEAFHPNKNLYEFNRYASLGELAYMQEKSVLARNAISTNPTRFLRLTLKRIGSFWTGIGGESTSFLQVAHMLLTTTSGLIGLAIMFRRKHPAAMLFATPLLLFPLPYYLTHPDPRFRLVLDPLLTILTAYAITTLDKRRQDSRI